MSYIVKIRYVLKIIKAVRVFLNISFGSTKGGPQYVVRFYYYIFSENQYNRYNYNNINNNSNNTALIK